MSVPEVPKRCPSTDHTAIADPFHRGSQALRGWLPPLGHLSGFAAITRAFSPVALARSHSLRLFFAMNHSLRLIAACLIAITPIALRPNPVLGYQRSHRRLD